eukprot:Phypoly_transcript_04239.p2 GENE.Phypoly_transcript_04239~~Phypoly_transcript_04239.p2  ORF type:complete len:232 (+),score=46.43 Phypoly_transcript_04239:1377-2072(+)
MESRVETKTAKDEEEFVSTGVNFLKSKIQEAISKRGKAVVGLSGGETPGPIYDKFFQDNEIDWSKVTIFLVDDRYIEATHKDSNTHLVFSSLQKNPSKSYNFVHPDTSLPLEKCIVEYENQIKKLLSEGPIDVLTLGLGPDGHIASLFPPVSDAIQNETTHQVIHTTTTQFAVFDRITVTFPVITHAQSKVFFLKTSKKKVWDEMISSSHNPTRWPAHKVIESGNTTLIIC